MRQSIFAGITIYRELTTLCSYGSMLMLLNESLLIMKITHFVAALSFLAPLTYGASQSSVNDELPPWLIEAEEEPELTQQQKVAVEEAAQLLLKAYRIVQKIDDRATADAAVPELRKLAQRADELEKSDIPGWLAIEKFVEYGGNRIQAEIYRNRIANNGFYGSHALAEVMGAPESAVFEFAAPTPELLEELGEEIKSAMVAMFPAVTGGPGFDEESAWCIPPQSEYEEAMFMAVLPDDYEPEHVETVLGDDDTCFVVIDYRLTRGGKVYPLNLWVDVTEAVELDGEDSEE